MHLIKLKRKNKYAQQQFGRQSGRQLVPFRGFRPLHYTKPPQAACVHKPIFVDSSQLSDPDTSPIHPLINKIFSNLCKAQKKLTITD